MCTPKNSNHLWSLSRALVAIDHSRLRLENKILGKQIRPNFLLSTSLLYKILPTSLGTCKPTFYTFYTSHLRWNSTIYHTDLGQNAVFHNFSRQFALSQCSGRSIVCFWWNCSKQISKITYTASQFSLLTSAKFAVNINRDMLQHNKEIIMFIFLFKGFIRWPTSATAKQKVTAKQISTRGTTK